MPGDVVGSTVEPAPLATTDCGQVDDALTAIGWIRRDRDDVVLLELAKQPAEVAGVEAKATSQVGNSRAFCSDLEQQPRRAEGTTGIEVGLGEHADALRVATVEPAKRRDLIHDR